MVLTNRQRNDLNKAIAGYLEKQGYGAALESFLADTDLKKDDINDKKYEEILEKKWTSVIRLQRRVESLQSDLSASQKEVKTLGTAKGQSSARDRTQWLPRLPARHTLNGHNNPITAVAFHPVYNQCCTASEDASIRVWNYEHGDYVKSLKGHTDSVNCIDFLRKPFAPQGKEGSLLASASADMMIKIWDVEDQYTCLKTLKGHEHNVSCVRFISADRLCSASRDSTIKIWKVESGHCETTLKGHLSWVRSVSPSPCGNFLASGSKDQSVRVWAPEKVGDWSSAKDKFVLQGHSNDVEDVCWANFESYASLELTDISNGEAKPAAGSGDSKVVPKKAKYVASASRDKTIMIWDITTQRCFITLAGHDNWVRGLAFHPGGKYLISVSDDKSIKSWILSTRSCAKSLSEAHEHFIQCVDVHPASKHVITGSVDKALTVWDCR